MTDAQSQVSALKLCPFCGGEAEWCKGQKGDGTLWEYIACAKCESMGPYGSCQKEGQILDWNTRVQPPEVSVGDLNSLIFKVMNAKNPTGSLASDISKSLLANFTISRRVGG